MISDDILLYPQISALSSVIRDASPTSRWEHVRRPLPSNYIICRERERERERESLNWRSPLSSSLKDQGILRKRRKECGSQRGWRTPAENGPLDQLRKKHMESQRLKWQAQSQHGSGSSPLCIYVCLLAWCFGRDSSQWKQVCP